MRERLGVTVCRGVAVCLGVAVTCLAETGGSTLPAMELARVGQELSVRVRLEAAYVEVRGGGVEDSMSVALAGKRAVEGGKTEYELRVWPRRAGRYDLMTQLVDGEGLPLVGRAQPYWVEVEGRIPEGDSGALASGAWEAYTPRESRYPQWMAGAVAVWIAACAGVVFRRGRKPSPPVEAGEMSVRPVTSLRELLTDGELRRATTERKQEIERRLLVQWLDEDPKAGLDVLRGVAIADERARPRLRLLDGWLYGGQALTEADVEELLRGLP